MKKILSSNVEEDGFFINFFSENKDMNESEFINNLEMGKKENIIETIINTGNARANFNYIKSSGSIHSHRFFEIEVIISGEIDEYNGYKTNRLKSNDVIIVSPNNYHSFTKVESNSYTIILNLAIKDDFFKDDMKFLFAYSYPQRITLEPQEVDTILQVLMSAYNASENTNEAMLSILKKKAISYVVMYIFSKLSFEDKLTCKEKEIFDAIVYINGNFGHQLSCDCVAKQFGYSPNYFSSIFKKVTGVPFSEYVLNLRLEKAGYMLIMGEVPITDISLTCGFNSTSYFSMLFKKKYGMSPIEYRNRLKKKALDK